MSLFYEDNIISIYELHIWSSTIYNMYRNTNNNIQYVQKADVKLDLIIKLSRKPCT